MAGQKPGSGTDPADLAHARGVRWWWTRRRIGSLERAAAFVDDLGFAQLFPKAGVALPSLWDAAVDPPVRQLGLEWGPETERVWGWKDELPRRGLAWYGRFLRGRPSFLSSALLADLYPRAGRPDDFLEEEGLGEDAVRIARILLRSGPQSTMVLREALSAEGPRGAARFDAALTELGKVLIVTNLGTVDEGSGWPSAVLELTARAFAIPRRRPGAEARRLRAARRFLDTQLAVRPYELGNAFGWRAGPAKEVLEALVGGGDAVRDGPAYVLSGLA